VRAGAGTARRAGAGTGTARRAGAGTARRAAPAGGRHAVPCPERPGTQPALSWTCCGVTYATWVSWPDGVNPETANPLNVL
jgi:hypothetical protein